MPNHHETMVARVRGIFEDFARDGGSPDRAARDAVEAVLTVLNSPSDAACAEGGKAAMRLRAGDGPDSVVGLVVLRSILGHIETEGPAVPA